MKKYQIKYNNKEHLIEGCDLINTLISFCKEKSIDINQIESCELIDEQKEFLIKFSNFWEKEYQREKNKKWYEKIFE